MVGLGGQDPPPPQKKKNYSRRENVVCMRTNGPRFGTLVVLRGNCPTNRGSCPLGVIVLRGSCPGVQLAEG